MAFTYIAGFLFTIVLCYCMGDPLVILDQSQPVAYIFYQSLGKTGGMVYTVCAFIILQFVCFTATQALGRTVFAFSRDRLLPFSKVWTIVNPYTGTPLYAVWLSVIFCVAINLIGLGSYTAILGVFNVCAIALDWSYCIPIFCKVVFGQFQPGPWNLGRASKFINIWACCWTLFVSIIFIMPTLRPVTADNMNYAIAFMALILLFSLVWWYAGGRKYYTGPLIEAEISESEIRDSSSGEVEAKIEGDLRRGKAI